MEWTFEKSNFGNNNVLYNVWYDMSNVDSYCYPSSITPVFEEGYPEQGTIGLTNTETGKAPDGVSNTSCYTSYCDVSQELFESLTSNWFSKENRALLGGCDECTAHGKSPDHPECLYFCCPETWTLDGITAWQTFLGEEGKLP